MATNEFATQVTLRGAPVSREVGIIERIPGGLFRVCGQGMSDETGAVVVTVSAESRESDFFAFAFDSYGTKFVPDMEVAEGDLIRPSEFDALVGLVYEVITGGTLPSEEPEWWEDTSVPQSVGTANLQAKKIFAPSVYGPMAMELELDPLWQNVVLLLPMDGEQGSTDFVDVSRTPHTITPIGNVQMSTARSKFGGSSAYYGGSGDTLQVTSAGDFNFEGDWTFEAFINSVASSATRVVFSIQGPGYACSMYWYSGNRTALYHTEAGRFITGSTYLTTNTWHHFAWVKQGDTYRIFLNGELDGQVTQAGLSFADAEIYVGSNGTSSQFWYGYIDEARITDGVARYTAPFAPPTAPFPR